MSTAEQDITKQTTIAALKAPRRDVAIAPDQQPGFFSLEAFELMQRVSKMFSESSIVPERYRGQIANCSIALEMANRLRASPLMVMQNLYVVYGSPAWAAKFLIACFNQSGKFTSIRYAFEGSPNTDGWGCRAWAVEISTGEKLIGPLISIALSKAEGWYGRKDSKWKTMPEQMLRYRSAAWFINTVAPEISMGLPTAEEAGDIFDAERGPDGSFGVTVESLRRAAATPAPEGRTIDAAVVTDGEKAAAEAAAKKGTLDPLDVAECVRMLKESGDKPTLAAAWQSVRDIFKQEGIEVSTDVETVYIDRLREVEAKK